MQASLQRSTVSFRRPGSSGRIWEDPINVTTETIEETTASTSSTSSKTPPSGENSRMKINIPEIMSKKGK